MSIDRLRFSLIFTTFLLRCRRRHHVLLGEALHKARTSTLVIDDIRRRRRKRRRRTVRKRRGRRGCIQRRRHLRPHRNLLLRRCGHRVRTVEPPGVRRRNIKPLAGGSEIIRRRIEPRRRIGIILILRRCQRI
uniref:Uncharacterized protein n=1 Tax=Opuntia streptacantha TaxID=393608 RepID=A0A7C9A9F8_OPUST